MNSRLVRLSGDREATVFRGKAQQLVSRHPDIEAGGLVRDVGQAHLAKGILVLVECKAIQPHGDPAASREHLTHRGDARTHDHVGARVGDDGRAAFRDEVHFVRSKVDAMRERDPLVHEPYLIEVVEDAFGKSMIRPPTLIARFQQMHVDPSVRRRRCDADATQHLIRAPLNARWPILHADARALDIRGHRLHHRDLLRGWKRFSQEAARDARTGLRRQGRQQAVMRIVNQRIHVPAMDGQRHVYADVPGGLRNGACFRGKIG